MTRIVIESAPRPGTVEGEREYMCSYETYCLGRLRQALPRRGSTTDAQCVEKAVEIVQEWRSHNRWGRYDPDLLGKFDPDASGGELLQKIAQVAPALRRSHLCGVRGQDH